MNKAKKWRVNDELLALGVGLLGFLWGAGGLLNLGFGILNTLFLIYILVRYPKLKEDRWSKIWMGISLVLGWFVAIRAYETVKILSMITAFVLNVVLAARAKQKQEVTPERVALGTVMTLLGTVGEGLKLLTGPKVEMGKRKIPLVKIVLGIGLGIPLVLAFGMLLYLANPIFGNLVNSIPLPRFYVNPEIAAKVVVGMWLGAQALALVRAKLGPEIKTRFKLTQITEAQIALFMVEALFLVYAVVQIRYWNVGGDELAAMGITYSQYTRSGYFQLILVSLLAWGLSLGIDGLVNSQREMKHKRITTTKVLGTMILIHVLLFVAEASKRNWQYIDTFGFTRVRLLGMGLSGWMVAMALLTIYKLAKEKSDEFLGKGLVTITAAAVLGLNLVNVDKTIMQYRPASLPTGIDYRYLVRLSDDAWEGWGGLLEDQVRLAGVEFENNQPNSEKMATAVFVVNKMYANHLGLSLWARDSWGNWGSWNLASFMSKKALDNNERWQRIVGELDKRNFDIKSILLSEAKRSLTD